MAKAETSVPAKPKKYDEWEVRDAMHTMMRAGEIIKDKKLLGLMQDVSQQASQLAKMGRISPKADGETG
jgi:hypothetical protein